MKYCRQCKVNVADPTGICPLCGSVLEKKQPEEGSGMEKKQPEEGCGMEKRQPEEGCGGTEQDGMYPKLSIPRKKYNLLIRISMFICLIAMLLLGTVNYLTYNGMMWSVICDAGILYLVITLRFSFFNNHEGLPMKILVQSLLAMAVCILVDVTTGYQGWSLCYAVPAAILLVDMVVLILMIANYKNWQYYILLQLGMAIGGIVLLILIRMGMMEHTIMALCAAGISVLFFLGTLIIGDLRARTELKRRFHI